MPKRKRLTPQEDGGLLTVDSEAEEIDGETEGQDRLVPMAWVRALGAAIIAHFDRLSETNFVALHS